MFAAYRNLVLIAFLCAALCAARAQDAKAQAQDAKTQARDGAVADGMSSVVGIAAGVPVNPLLPVLGVAFKAVTFEHAESLPEAERPRAYALAAAGWQGSAAGNACAAVSALSGGAFLPACIALGVAWGKKTWDESERERQEAERCAAVRASVRKPKTARRMLVAATRAGCRTRAEVVARPGLRDAATAVETAGSQEAGFIHTGR